MPTAPNAPQTPPRQIRAAPNHPPPAPPRNRRNLRVDIPAFQMNMNEWQNNNMVIAGPPGGAPNEIMNVAPRVRREALQFNMNVNMGMTPPGGEPAEGGRRRNSRKSRRASRKNRKGSRSAHRSAHHKTRRN
jgi:pyruvate/2-oxoglutarate dehydrogenase complex dihydrolipoamide acyltransferase (E2) component